MRRLLFIALALALVLACSAASAAVIKDFTYTPLDHAVELEFTAEGYDSVVINYTNSFDKGKITLKSADGHYTCKIDVPSTYPGNNVSVTIKSSKGKELMKKTYVKTAMEDIPLADQAAEGHLKGVVVCVDPGHQGVECYAKEPMGPGLSGYHNTSNGQAQGTYTRRYESVVVLEVGKKLRNALLEEGATVVMTREDQETPVTNMRRAEIANDAGAHVFIRLHCDNAGNTNARGIFVYIPLCSTYAKAVADKDTYRTYGEALLKAMKDATGVVKGTVRQNNSYVASNWATMPAFLIEFGFMSNTDDDILISTPEFQQKLVEGIVNGVEEIARMRGIIE